MDPGTIPPQLQQLTQVEEMLISAVIPIMSLYRLPQGQYGYSGHVVNLPQDIQSFASTLPRQPTDLDIIVVRKEGASQTHRDFHVRRSKVLTALQWLVANNTYYRNIHIDHEALALIPEDGDFTDQCSVAVQDLPTMILDGDDDGHLVRTFVPITPRRMTEQETVRQEVQVRQSPPGQSAVMWPSTAATPVNEFNSEGYMSCAFPVLFPTGAADFLVPRQHHVTIGNYFKHLMMYEDGRFAKHPRFPYFALNTEMRWRALQAGQIYVRQHPGDSQLTVDELRDMVGHEGQAFSNRVMHYATSLRGTRPYWLRQRSRLVAMVDTLGLPTVFFTHSAADTHWPELARLICPEDSDSRTSRSSALAKNPAVADWFFYRRIHKFVDAFYVDILGASDYWLRFEWQHRGSPHVHGLAWFSDAPNAEEILSSSDSTMKDELARYIDSVVCTSNPGILPDGSNSADAPPARTNPHVCNQSYTAVQDYGKDLTDLVATCQRHTRCSASYCLRKKQGGEQKCRFGYPKPLQQQTTFATEGTEDDESLVLTARNDSLVNGYNPIQLSAWRANVDLQYCVSRRKVIGYCTKYVTKSEPRSQPLKEIFGTIVRSLKEGNTSLKVVQKLLINTIGERDYSAQETSHLLLQLPLFRASRDFIVLGLDGSRAVENHLEDGHSATAPSILDHYLARPTTPPFCNMTLLAFTRKHTMPKELSSQPHRRNKDVIVIARPYCSSDPAGPNYEKYCRHKLMLHSSFRQTAELLAGYDTYSKAYAQFLLSSSSLPPSLEDDIHRIEEQRLLQSSNGDNNEDQSSEQPSRNSTPRDVEEWMLICQSNPDLQADTEPDSNLDWTNSSLRYPNLDEMPSFISTQRQSAMLPTSTNTADPQLLLGKQFDAYNIVHQHMQTNGAPPLRMVVSGTAGTGKSFLINCLRRCLKDKLRVAAPTGVAAFNIEGQTLHSLFSLPTKADFKDLEGDRLHRIQQSLSNVQYLIIDEMSMVGRKIFGEVDRRLRQVFPHKADQILGGCSCILFGDFGQLPPVMDLPLYTTVPRNQLSDLGSAAYQSFDQAVVLDHVMRQSGQDPNQVLFRDILLRLRNATTSVADWKQLMTQTPAHITDSSSFTTSLHLYPTVQAVVDHNIAQLRSSNRPIATINAVHTGSNASKSPADDAGGLQPIVHLAASARVMLTANLWVEVGLVNGAMGTVMAICYRTGGPPDLPIAVMVCFDSYSGPTLPDRSVPITPMRRTWCTSGSQCSRLQLPLKLAWAVTIHKAQGLTLDKVVIDVGKREFSSGLTFVACSRVRRLRDILFSPPFSFQRLANLSKNQRLQERQNEDVRLHAMSQERSPLIPAEDVAMLSPTPSPPPSPPP